MYSMGAGAATAQCWMVVAIAASVACWMNVAFVMVMGPHANCTLLSPLRYPRSCPPSLSFPLPSPTCPSPSLFCLSLQNSLPRQGSASVTFLFCTPPYFASSVLHCLPLLAILPEMSLKFPFPLLFPPLAPQHDFFISEPALILSSLFLLLAYTRRR